MQQKDVMHANNIQDRMDQDIYRAGGTFKAEVLRIEGVSLKRIAVGSLLLSRSSWVSVASTCTGSLLRVPVSFDLCVAHKLLRRRRTS